MCGGLGAHNSNDSLSVCVLGAHCTLVVLIVLCEDSKGVVGKRVDISNAGGGDLSYVFGRTRVENIGALCPCGW